MTDTNNGHPQPRRTVDSAMATIEEAVGDLARKTTQGLDTPPHAPHGAAESVERHINAMVARSTQAVIERLETLEQRITHLKQLIMDDSARVQAELQGHILIGETANAAADVIEKRVNELCVAQTAKMNGAVRQ